MRKTVVILFLIFVSLNVFSNGGVVGSKGSAYLGSGNIKLITEKECILESEDLFIHVSGDNINVTAIYQITNTGEAKDLTYGFAIDYVETSGFIGSAGEVNDFIILNNSKKISYKVVDERKIDIVKNRFGYNNEQMDTVSRKWYISDIHFAKNETKRLYISYTIIANYFDYDVFRELKFPDDTRYPANFSERSFMYNLKPSSSWGDGTVKRFNLEVSFDNIAEYDEYSIYGVYGFTQNNNTLFYSAQDFSFLENEYLKLRYSKSDYINTLEAMDYNKSELFVKSIKCSSQEKSYPKENLLDKNENTTYVASSNSGVNEWIYLELHDSIKLSGIGIINGFPKSHQTYSNNNVAKKIRLSIFFEKDTIVFDDFLKRKTFPNHTDEVFIGVEDIIWGDIVYNDLIEELGEPDIGAPVAIKFEILSIDKGVKYDDTCISEIMVYGEKER